MATAFEIADILELWVWSNQQEITVSDLASWLETAVPEESLGYSDADLDAAEIDDPFELLAEQVFEALQERANILEGSYPFTTNGNRIRYSGPTPPSSSYLFCLLLSYLPATLIHNDQRTRQFESLAMEAARNFFGAADAVRIGFPWETQTYSDLLDTVRSLLPSLGRTVLSETVTAGDRGWDILVVKGCRDRKFPNFVALGNCATGRRDWRVKGQETDAEYFWQCFQSQRPGTYVTFSAVPFFMDDDDRDRKVNRGHFTFDRYRICELAPNANPTISAWVESQRINAQALSIDAIGS